MAAKKKAANTNRGNGRTKDGKFAKGNSGGPGNPNLRRLGELQRAVKEACTADDMREVIKGLLERAKNGDNDASRVLCDRVLGRPAQAKAEPVAMDLDLPEVKTSADVVAAASQLMQAIQRGEISTDESVKITGLIELTRKTIETNELQEQLDELKARLDRE